MDPLHGDGERRAVLAEPPVSRGEAQYTRSPLWVTLDPAPVWAFLEERDISDVEEVPAAPGSS